MRLILAILGGLLFVAAMVIWASLTPIDGLPTGAAHPDIPHMSIGGDAAARSMPLLLPIYFWQVGVIVTACLLLLLGIAPRRRTGAVVIGVGCVGLVCIAVWTGLIVSYRDVLLSGETPYALGFPVTTAWMNYGIWLSLAGFTGLYVWGFKRFIHTDEDEAAFQAIVAANLAAQDEADA